ncbi:DUF4238 domain-containing protein [Apilactobacillus kunkeei]|uniref:DUF4238 domain-containing protein n=1 Tax=Apilactobacillus kunkeei TaxID=148814 RepID=A0A1L8CGY1_9LACO|nr:DUF4238 domain-containing protein [Apilactobacillus kunkeei]GAT90451.1 hypothetical protein FF306_00549 [Apilactobacillus kunkeei]
MIPNKREHYVSQFYQKNFSDDKKTIYCYYNGKYFIAKISQTLQSEYLYDQIPYEYIQEAIVRGYKEKPYMYDDQKVVNELKEIKSDKKYLEHKLGKIEIKVSNIISDLIKYESGTILKNKPIASFLLAFIFQLEHRSKKRINQINNITQETFEKQTLGIDISERVSFKNIKYRMMANNLINLTKEEQYLINQIVNNWDISLCINKSNTPFIFGESSLYKFYRGKELLFPISTSMAILFQQSKTDPLNIYKPEYVRNNTYNISSSDVKKSNYLQCLYSLDGTIVGDKSEIMDELNQIKIKLLIERNLQSIKTKY